MRTPQIVMGTAIVILVVLLFTSPRHRVPVYSTSSEGILQGVVQDVQEFYCPISGDEGTHLLVKTEDEAGSCSRFQPVRLFCENEQLLLGRLA